MKKNLNFKFTLALLVTMLTGAANLQAANYNLKICGVQVTDDNKGDLSGIPGVTAGTISYNSDTKTLTLQGVTMGTSGTVACIYTTIDGMIIDVNGNNTLTGNGWAPVSCDASNSLTIMGSGKLNISNAHKEQRAIYMRRGSLTIKDCTITASGGRNAINLGEWDSNAEITIDRANVTVSLNPDGDRHSTIVGFKKMNLKGCVISQPTDVAYNTAENKRTFCYLASGDIFKGEVKITPGASYDLWICGVRVTDGNKNNLSVIPGVTGEVVYLSADNTLILKDATITSPTEHGILTTMYGMAIKIFGNNTITVNSTSKYGINFDKKDVTIWSQTNGALTINAPSSKAIYVNQSTLTIKECTIKATGGQDGILGFYSRLKINTANVTATGTANGSIHGFNSITLLNECSLTSPAGAKITDGNITDANGNIIKTEVKISVPSYDLKICGVQVTAINRYSLNLIDGVTGYVNYNPDTKILTLSGASITIPDGANAIRSDIEGLTIDVQNNNSVNSDGWATMRFNKPGTIKGGGTLNVNHSTAKGWALYANCSLLTIENCMVNATSTGRSITGNDKGKLTINNATITSKGVDGSITHFANINLNGCVISEPAGAVISKGADDFYAVRNASGNIITEVVKIVPATIYDLKICGVPVTSLNKNNLSSIPGVSAGTVSYNPDNKTLTLNGATMSVTGKVACIYTKIDGMIINVIGVNTLTGDDWSPISCDGNNSCTIQGNGTINITNKTASSGAGIFTRNGNLTIKTCKLNIVSGGAGIIGNTGEKSLTIDNATVSALGKVEGSITGFKELNLKNCFITQPAGAVFNTEKKAVCYANGTIVKETVKIVPGTPTGLNELGTYSVTLYPNPVKDILHIQSEKAVTTVHIYNINGAAVSQTTGENIHEINITHLSAGTYMIRVETGDEVSVMRIVKR